MSLISQTLSKLTPSMDGPSNLLRDAWDRLSPLPGGKLAFSRLIGRMAPYTGSIDGRVTVLRKGYCETTLKDRRAVRNHLKCVHAIALANLAELTGNVGVGYAMPDDARFIVAGLNIEYLQKARGTITGICEAPTDVTAERKEYQVLVRLQNDAGEDVARCTLKTLVGPKKSKKDRQ